MTILDIQPGYVAAVKPYGMLSEADAGGRDNMPGALASALAERGEKNTAVYPVHRLDATTEGVMVYARTAPAAAALSREITEGRLHKRYLAWITAADTLPSSGTMTDFLFFDRRAGKSFVVQPGKKGAKEARLSYLLGEPFDWDGHCLTPAWVDLQTGRTHQIRVQFASRQSPLAGDGKYGSRIKRHAPSLWSAELSFVWNGLEKRYVLPGLPPFPEKI